ncbi:hypothetical protein H4219_003290 [Mycoemilia scoparia]|uniref:CS domain-containing protein n=1 Tax=Mycoemilia scoparia TaxID=417184 RepID=A0A9W7ZVY2_9FUNG|nr:hypothetical protein H4219_003290 [Mycoemilia scoparia]
MITPKFSVIQDDKRVYISINAPYIRTQEIDFDVQGSQFKFHAKPYYLRLELPGNVVEDEDSTASFDVGKGCVEVRLTKATPGEHFPDLDLITKLLATKSQIHGAQRPESKIPLIQKIGSDLKSVERVDKDTLEDFDWELPQEIYNSDDEDESKTLIKNVYYGFDQRYNGWFAHVDEMANDINEIAVPEKMSSNERRAQRVEAQNDKFDEDYYISDYMYDDEILEVVGLKSPYHAALRQLKKTESAAKEEPGGAANSSSSDGALSEFLTPTDREKAIMQNLPKREYVIKDEKSIYLGLVDIVFGYLYQYRSSRFENNVESAWNIGKLSASLAALEHHSAHTLKEVIVTSFSRALAYPLFRNWDLCQKVLRDTYDVFRLGRRALLKILLDCKDLFDHHDIYYVYSKILFDDYCVWIQTHAKDSAIRSLASKLHRLEIHKSDIGWNLEAFEDLALETTDDDESEDGSGEQEDMVDAPEGPEAAHDTTKQETFELSKDAASPPPPPPPPAPSSSSQSQPHIPKPEIDDSTPKISLGIGNRNKQKPLIQLINTTPAKVTTVEGTDDSQEPGNSNKDEGNTGLKKNEFLG